MSTNAVTKCDECDAEKREVNNWKSMVGQPERPAFYTFEEANLITAPDGDEVRRDYCGHKCASSAFNRWLDTGSVLPAVKTEVADAAQSE
jgi:hypothetical protein